MSTRLISLLILAAIMLPGCAGHRADTIIIGGKKFSEQSILGEMYAALIEKNTRLKVERRFWSSYEAGADLANWNRAELER